MAYFILLVAAVTLVIYVALCFLYESAVPDKDVLISNNFEKRVYPGSKKVDYIVNGRTLPWYLNFLAEADMRILLIKDCMLIKEYYTSKGQVIPVSEKFQNHLDLYDELVLCLCEVTQGRPERDPRMITAAPYAYIKYYLKPLNSLQRRTRAFLTR